MFFLGLRKRWTPIADKANSLNCFGRATQATDRHGFASRHSQLAAYMRVPLGGAAPALAFTPAAAGGRSL